MTTHVVADIHQVQRGDKELRIIELSNSLDSESAWEFEQALDEIVSNGHYLVIIDLSKVDFISSAGWGIFTGDIKRIRDAGGDLKLAGMQPAVFEVFDLLELDAFITAHDTVEEAAAAFEAVPMDSGPPASGEAAPEEPEASALEVPGPKKTSTKGRKKKSATATKRSRKTKKKTAASTRKATARTKKTESEASKDGKQAPEATNGNADITTDVRADGSPAEEAAESAPSESVELPSENVATVSDEPQPELDAATEDIAPPITTDEQAPISVVNTDAPVSDTRLVPLPPDERTIDINHRLSFEADVERLLGLLPVDVFGAPDDQSPSQVQAEPQTDPPVPPSLEEKPDRPSAPSWYSAIGLDESIPESVALLSGPGAFVDQFSNDDQNAANPVVSEEAPVASEDDTDHAKHDLSAPEAASEHLSGEMGKASSPASEEAAAGETNRDEVESAPAVPEEAQDEEKKPTEAAEPPQDAQSGSEPEPESGNARENPDPEDIEFEAECMFFEEAFRTDLYFRPSPLPEFDAVEETAAAPPSGSGLAGNEEGGDVTEHHQTGIIPGEPSDGDPTLGSLSFDIRDIEVEFPPLDRGKRQKDLQEALGRREDIEAIIRNFPDYGPDRIARLLNSSAFGYVRMHIDILRAALGELDLDTPEKRQAFANCSEDVDSSGIVF